MAPENDEWVCFRNFDVLYASMGPGPDGPGKRPRRGRKLQPTAASMGPGPDGPGKLGGSGRLIGALHSFNGAGAGWPRKTCTIWLVSHST